MEFEIKEAQAVLERTPKVIKALLNGLPAHWLHTNEGEGSWSPFDIVGHLIHGEKTDWTVRTRILMGDQPLKEFEPFDRFAQFEESKGKTTVQLLAEFAVLRRQNLQTIKKMKIVRADLGREGRHPEFGRVTLEQLLATWVVHDLNHIAQICRVLSGHYRSEVGPWERYLGILGPATSGQKR